MATAASIGVAAHNTGTQSGGRKGMEPNLYNGALSGSVEVVCQFNWPECVTPVGNNILHVHLGKPLNSYKTKVGKEAVSVEFIRDIVYPDVGYCLLWKQNANGDTPLHLDVRFRHRESVKELLNRIRVGDVGRLLTTVNTNKDTALHEATRVKQVDVVKMLLVAAGPSGSLQNYPNVVGETPLYLAVESGCDQTVGVLLNSGLTLAINHKGPCGRTALHAAILCETTAEIVQMMLKVVDMSIVVQDDQGSTSLHLAALKDSSLELLKLLLTNDNGNESAVYIQDNEGRTALHNATRQCSWNALKELASFHPDSIEIVDNKGQNVVHYAASLGCLRKFKKFLKLGFFDKLVNDKDMNGNTPLHLLLSSNPGIPVHYCFYKIRSFIRVNLMEAVTFNSSHLLLGDVLVSNLVLSGLDFIRKLILQVEALRVMVMNLSFTL